MKIGRSAIGQFAPDRAAEPQWRNQPAIVIQPEKL
jgi:hypothetical protein